MKQITFGILCIAMVLSVIFPLEAARPEKERDDWGKITKAKPEFYAAGDVPNSHVQLTKEWYEIAAAAWGNYGPLEFWIVGSDVEAARRMDKEYCNVRKSKDAGYDVSACAKRDYNFVKYATEGNAGLNTQRNEHNNWSGFIVTMASRNPGPHEEDYKTVTLHEYFHVYQHAHIFSRKHAERESRTQTNPWWIEGGAEYMAQLLYSRQEGVREGYLNEKMERKLRALSDLEDGVSIRDIPYGERGHVGYSLGAWFVAYVIHKSDEHTYLVKFHKDLNKLGFEGSFLKHFGASSDDLLKEFHEEFLKRSLPDMLKILPPG